MGSMKALVLSSLILASLALPVLAADAPAPIPLKTLEPGVIPVRAERGGFYRFWYGTPLSNQGLNARKAFVRVHEVQGDWVFADLIYEESMAMAMLVVAELQKGDPALEKLLTDTGKAKEELLEKVAKTPPGEADMRSLWINLVQVEAIERIDLKAEMEKARKRKEDKDMKTE